MCPDRLSPQPPTVSTTCPPRKSYHHGNLRQALLEAALQLAVERGPEQVTVREAARRVGVSPAAPFRHFPDREALMTALAEEAMGQFQQAIAEQMHACQDGSPLQRLLALGKAFLDWTRRHPVHFQILSTRHLIDFNASPKLVAGHCEARLLSETLLQQAQEQQLIESGDTALLALMSRALIYGLARMQVDGQLPQWGIGKEEEEERLFAAAQLFVHTLEKPR